MGVQRDVEDRSLPPPVAETGRRSVGNRKERWYIATMRVSRAPKATITILIHFDRTFLLIPTGCALRWAQKDEGEIQIARGTRIVATSVAPCDSRRSVCLLRPLGAADSGPLHPSGLPYPLLKRLGGISTLTHLSFAFKYNRATESQLYFCALRTGLYKVSSAC